LGKRNNSLLYSLRDYAITHLSPATVDRIGRIIPQRLMDRLGSIHEIRSQTLGSIDWGKTDAYAIGSASGGIYVRDERLRLGIAMKLERLGFRCWYKEDVYRGEYVKEAPDLLIEMGSSHWYPISFGGKIWQETTISGSHIVDGLFIAYGEGVEKRKLGDMSIYDVTPTILKLMGVPIPANIDGGAVL